MPNPGTTWVLRGREPRPDQIYGYRATDAWYGHATTSDDARIHPARATDSRTVLPHTSRSGMGYAFARRITIQLDRCMPDPKTLREEILRRTQDRIPVLWIHAGEMG